MHPPTYIDKSVQLSALSPNSKDLLASIDTGSVDIAVAVSPMSPPPSMLARVPMCLPTADENGAVAFAASPDTVRKLYADGEFV